MLRPHDRPVYHPVADMGGQLWRLWARETRLADSWGDRYDSQAVCRPGARVS